MTKEQFNPVELLDRALCQKPGMGEAIGFAALAERESFKFRLYAAMSADARRSLRLDEPSDPTWGKHRWDGVRIEPLDDLGLWIGRAAQFNVSEPVSLETARATSQVEKEEE